MIWNWLRRRPRLVDSGAVAFLLAITVAAAMRHNRPTAGVILGIAETLPLLLRRRHPVAVLAVVTAVGLAMIGIGVWIVPLQVGAALYTVATLSERRTSRLAVTGTISVVVAALLGAESPRFGDSVSRVVFLGAAWLLGDGLGSRRAYVREVEEKADRLERERDSENRRAAAEEQARIARELHDVVAHALSVIVVQAAAADDVFEVDPARVREPIRAIETAARAALGDLRRVLGVLQDEPGLNPQPGLATIDTLVEQVRATGLAVSLEIEGSPRPLPAAVDLSAYRIVQEALTNTLKHADAEHASVRVRYGDELGLEVVDDGAGAASDSVAGSGLIGMRERAAMLGGTVDAGRAPGGGYLVRARIPIGVS